ncbi:hypothetical protein GCM10023185_27160 [Hymenobacter saemangeumensis]|uniref:O-antigen ligase domain-containing protein n=2 Tax=Hymenobacter saemangeumensis TaxID=1084522 RepID=A0ABP8IJB0_9BACT
MSELLLQSVVLLLAWYGVGLWKNRKPREAVGLVLAACLAPLIKPVFYPMAGLIAVGLLGMALHARRPSLALLGCLPVLVLGLYMGWNKQRTGFYHFSSIAEINLLHYNGAGVVRQLYGKETEDQWVSDVLREANAQPGFAQRQKLIQKRAGTMLSAHAFTYARQHALGVFAFFLDPGRFDFNQFFHLAPLAGGGLSEQLRAAGVQELAATLLRLPLGILFLLALITAANAARLLLAARGFWLAGKGELRAGRWWLAGLLLYVAVLTGPLGAARFLVPVWPLLLLLALLGLSGSGISRAEGAVPVRESQG